MSPSMDQIASALKFTLEDLTLNRAGQMSSRQAWETIRFALVMGLGTLTLGGAAALAVVSIRQLPLRIFAGFVSVGILVFGSWFTWRAALDAVTQDVATIEAPLSELGAGTRNYNALLILGPHREYSGSVPLEASKVLTVGKRYRVYYCPRTQRFLSLEPASAITDEAGGRSTAGGERQ